jgi:hypothetical protein
MFVLQFLLVAAIKFLPKLVHILEPVIVPFSQNVRTSRFLAREYHAAPSQSSASFGNTCTWTTNEGPKHCQEQRQPLAPQAVPRPCNEKEEAPKEQSRPEETPTQVPSWQAPSAGGIAPHWLGHPMAGGNAAGKSTGGNMEDRIAVR